jgi:protein phosphatase
VDVDLWELHLEAGDRIVLCSDGLTNEVSVDQMAEVLSRVADPREAALALVHAANEHGGSDNITVVVVDVLVGEGPGSDDGAVAAASAGATAAAAASTSGPGRGPGPAPPDGTPPPVVAPPLPPPPAPPSRPTPESREVVPSSRRRRAAGVPRRVTFRVLLFALLVVAIVAAAYGVVRWYATNNWFVTLDGRQLVVYQGRPGGLLWFRPKLVDRSTVTTAGILPESLPALRADVDKPSLAAARTYISNLHQEFLTQLQTGIGQSTSTTPATTFPATTTTTTTTTTVPAAG